MTCWSALVAGCGASQRESDDDSGQAGADQGGGSGKGGGSGASGGKGGTGTSGGKGGTGGTDPSTTNVYISEIRNTAVDKVDLLLMVDNSLSMANKQKLLADAIPVLVQRLVTPLCLDAQGKPTGAVTDANGQCGQGHPEFSPIQDLHVGIVTSSLGDHGSNDVCSDAQNQANIANGSGSSYYNDAAQLLPSVRPDSGLYSWSNTGFLVWDPRDQTKVRDPHTPITQNETNKNALASALSKHVLAAGEHGCAYEGSLEAWYRFLVDPEPVRTLSNDGGASVRGPTNDVLLEQRAAFLRPDSLLAIVMISDENDCSIIDEDRFQGWLVGYKGGVGSLTWHMPRATSACANPNDPCCRPCSTPTPDSCPDSAADSACSLGPNLTLNEDALALRCFDQVQRFGVNLLYPTSRYVEALQKPLVTPRFDGAQVPNPLFAAAAGVAPRSPDQVILMGILGVPWQDIATEDSWSSAGRGLTYMTAEELQEAGRWDMILGAPDASPPVPPADPLMIESIDPRPSGAAHPLLANAAIQPPTGGAVNPINGHEQATLDARDDLQFACTFPLMPPVSAAECTTNPDGCACNSDEFERHSPLCMGTTADADGSQIADRAYPSLRELEVLKGAGPSGVVASICPKNTTPQGSTASDPDYGYNPAMAALAARMATVLGPKCLPRQLTPSPSDANQVGCTIVEATAPGACDCAAAGRKKPSAALAQSVAELMGNLGECDTPTTVACSDLCLCAVPELAGDDLAACQAGDAVTGASVGYCYIDPAQGLGSDAAVAECPANERRKLRFIGDDVPAATANAFIVCAGATATGL